MNTARKIKITGMGKYLPQLVNSAELEEKHGLPLGWSERYSGVKTRHHATSESNGSMGANALKQALADAKIQASDLDLIISASATYDYPLPSNSSIIKSEIEDTSSVGTMDIDSTCLSFVSAFEMASKLLDGTQYKHIAIVSSEIASKGIDPNKWETLTLFGDGAASFILSYDETSERGFVHGGIKTYSEGVHDTIIKGGGNKYFFKDHPYDAEMHSFHMNGKRLLRLAKKKIPGFMSWFFEGLNTTITDIDLVIPHQASKAGVGIFRNMYPFKDERFYGNLETHGNCISASIPMSLFDAISEGKLKRGQSCLICGTSAGFSIGAVLFTY
ncbi:MAG: 3-oxoacyl-[acyl-carrier-protein] synthase-3 [Parvicellaceae bacterium]|jgi:3-oxoacyl-[acyl-carrier-protein] synthase-3